MSTQENRPKDGPACQGCGLPNYQGFCPVCRGDADAYERELAPYFGPWHPPASAGSAHDRETG